MLTYCHIVQLMWVTSDVTTSQEVLLQKKCSLTCAFLSNVCNAQLMPRVLVNTNSLQCFFYLYINIHIFINQYFCFLVYAVKYFWSILSKTPIKSLTFMNSKVVSHPMTGAMAVVQAHLPQSPPAKHFYAHTCWDTKSLFQDLIINILQQKKECNHLRMMWSKIAL